MLKASSLLLVFTIVIATGMAVAAQTSRYPIGGNPITVYSGTGAEAAQITVLSVADPFEEWADFYEPRRGERYIVVEIQAQATGERPFEFRSYDIGLLDTIGHIHKRGWFNRSPTSAAALPDLEDAVMLPGETITGAFSATVPTVADLAQVVYGGYADSVERLYLLADLTVSDVSP
jgi:hypothetical protein